MERKTRENRLGFMKNNNAGAGGGKVWFALGFFVFGGDQ